MNIDAQYQTYRELGISRADAKLWAYLDAVRSDEEKQLAAGRVYSAEAVRQAAVHSRQDLTLLSYQLGQTRAVLTSIRRWIVAGVILIVVMALWRL